LFVIFHYLSFKTFYLKKKTINIWLFILFKGFVWFKLLNINIKKKPFFITLSIYINSYNIKVGNSSLQNKNKNNKI